MPGFLAELKRRNVIRVGVFYAVAGWLVLQVADVLFGLLGVPEWSLRLVLVILLLGLPVVLVFSWVFELTPEGLKRDRGEHTVAVHSGTAARRLDVATILMLVVTIGFVAWDRMSRDGATSVRVPTEMPRAPAPLPGQPELSIAVLPFANISGNAENEYFSDGLSEELLNLLAKIPDFKVAGRTSSFVYKGRNEDLRTIGDALDVANVLEGSVRRQDDRVRITAQLIDAASGYHRWSETYDRTIDDIFAVQEEIATEVVRELRTTLLNDDERLIGSVPRTDVAAYDRYLKGQEHARDRTRPGLERAVDAFQEAVVLDPQYAPAWSGLAMAYALQENYGYVDTEMIAPRIERVLEQALALDPDNSEALAVRGIYLMNLADHASAPESLRLLQQAVTANPNNAMAHLWLAQHLLPDREAARPLIERAIAIDPGSPIILMNYATFLANDGRIEEANRVLAKLESISPDIFFGWVARGDIAFLEGRIADAALAFERARQLNPDYPTIRSALARIYYLIGEHDASLAQAREKARMTPDENARQELAYLEAMASLRAGRTREAAERYRRVVGSRPTDPLPVAMLAALELANDRVDEALAITAAGLELPAADAVPVTTLKNGFAVAVRGLALRAANQDLLAQAVGARLVEVAEASRKSGIRAPELGIGRGIGLGLQGWQGALAAGARQSIRDGWRNSVEEMRLLDPGGRGGAGYQAVIEEMSAVLAAERQKYLAAKGAAGMGS